MLNKLPAETIGIWNVFTSITALMTLLDFGFQPSFARNISYIFSGAHRLQKEGVEVIEACDQQVDYSLLKGTIRAMQKFYRWMSLTVLVVLLTAGTGYLYMVLKHYSGDPMEIWVSWGLLIGINSFNLYTMYYDALMVGKGYVKRIQQINILGQSCYLIIGISMILAGCGLVAIVSSQLASVIIKRVLARRVFFTPAIKTKLGAVEPSPTKPILNAIVPNAVKMGLTNLGGFAVNRSAILIGTPVLPLADMAMYGISYQIIEIISRCACVPYSAYIPKMAQCRVEDDKAQLRRLYQICVGLMAAVMVVGGGVLIGLGDWALELIHSKTPLLPSAMLLVMMITHLLEKNHVIAAGFILSDNKIPFFIPSLIAGAVTIGLLFLFIDGLHWGVWGLILAPMIAQIVYQNWKWPSVIIKELYGTKHGKAL